MRWRPGCVVPKAWPSVTDCFNSGLAPPSGHAATWNSPTWRRALACVAGDVRATTDTELQAVVPACDGIAERGGQACATAISRDCASVGAVSGFGAVESAGDEVTVTCVTNATRVSTTLEQLSAFVSRCVPDPVTCSLAAWGLCETTGHAGGFGPVEVAGLDLEVVCLD